MSSMAQNLPAGWRFWRFANRWGHRHCSPPASKSTNHSMMEIPTLGIPASWTIHLWRARSKNAWIPRCQGQSTFAIFGIIRNLPLYMSVYVDDHLIHLSGECEPGEGIKSGASFGRQKAIYGGVSKAIWPLGSWSSKNLWYEGSCCKWVTSG